MGWEEITAGVVGVTILGLPIVITGWLVKQFLARRHRHFEELGERGSVHVAQVWLVVGLIVFGCGALLGGAAALPLLVWIFDSDPEGRQVFFAMVSLFAGFTALAAALSWPGLRFWIVEPNQVTVHRLGRERSIEYPAINEIRERRSVGGFIEIRAGDRRLRVPKQLTGFDDFLSQVKLLAPHAPFVGRSAPTHEPVSDPAMAAVPVTETTTYSLSKGRTRLIIGFMGSLLLFLLIGPWFAVTGDHPVRDSFIFMGMGFGFWLVILLLVAQESFQRDQPARLELRPGTIAYRVFWKGWQIRPATELVSASVESDIIYVRGMPGHRHPLFLTFSDGSRVKIDDFRAKHLGASTHQLTTEFHRRYFDASQYSLADRGESDRLLEEARDADARCDLPRAIELHQQAIASYPDSERLASYRRVGDLQRQLGHHVTAVSSYRAHLDFAPRDTAAWEGLAASLREGGRDDLAAEAIQSAERLLLHG